MKFITHNDEMIDINGSHRQGYLTAQYAKLRALFGKPHEGDGYKVDWEWSVEFEDGTVASIYNWKSGPNYGYDTVGPGQITEWNVGGFNQQAVENLKKVLLTANR